MKVEIKYIVDKRYKPARVTPVITVDSDSGSLEFRCTEKLTVREAQEYTRALVANSNALHETFTQQVHEEVDISDIRSYDE